MAASEQFDARFSPAYPDELAERRALARWRRILEKFPRAEEEEDNGKA